uniref:Uncharacterized protein n=1 Tax=Anguilla anguilla TaxID=7936 RepID=A0A0E9UY12_ANGAN
MLKYFSCYEARSLLVYITEKAEEYLASRGVTAHTLCLGMYLDFDFTVRDI